MHAEVTGVVRDLIRLRAQLQPYLYDLCWRHTRDFDPIVRPTFAEFPDDTGAYEDCDELMLGRSLLVASVVEPDATSRRVRLPAGAVWRDFWTGARHDGGTVIELPAPWGRPPLLVPEGAAIAMNVAEQHFDRRGDERAFAIFAPEQGEFTARCFEDDGASEAWREGGYAEWVLTAAATPERIDLTLSGGPPGPRPAVLLRPSETRAVFCEGRRLAFRPFEAWRRADLPSTGTPASQSRGRSTDASDV
jgi:alpha-glucosidase